MIPPDTDPQLRHQTLWLFRRRRRRERLVRWQGERLSTNTTATTRGVLVVQDRVMRVNVRVSVHDAEDSSGSIAATAATAAQLALVE